MQKNENEKLKHTPKKGPGFEQVLLIGSGVAVGGIAAMAMTNLIPETGASLIWKSLLIGGMAGVVSYSVNHFAITKGASLAAKGFRSALIGSVSSIVLIGCGLFASTYAGVTIDSVDELRLHEYAQNKSSFIDQSNATVSQSLRAKPVINSISNDLKDKVRCEIETACLSNRGGGRGTVTRALELSSSRADQIVIQMDNGNQNREAINRQLHELVGKFQTVLGDEEKGLKKRRQELLEIDAKIDQLLNELNEAIPTALLIAYASELESGVDIAGRPSVTQTLKTLLGNHARALTTALNSIDANEIISPTFPARAGVSSTFSYIGHFLPIAAIVAVVELILPLILFTYAYLGLLWEIETEEDRRANAATTQRPKQQPLSNDQSYVADKRSLNGQTSPKPPRGSHRNRNSKLGGKSDV